MQVCWLSTNWQNNHQCQDKLLKGNCCFPHKLKMIKTINNSSPHSGRNNWNAISYSSTKSNVFGTLSIWWHFISEWWQAQNKCKGSLEFSKWWKYLAQCHPLMGWWHGVECSGLFKGLKWALKARRQSISTYFYIPISRTWCEKLVL